MKKIITLFVCVLTVFLFEACATHPYTGVPEPEPKPRPRPKPRPAPKPQAVAPKKVRDVSIVTDNLYAIPKALNVDNDLTISSLTPVAYTSQDHCNEVYFFTAIVTPTSGYHGLVDISMSETKINGGYSCKYFGSAIVYQIKPNPFVKETIKYEDIVRKVVPE